MFQVITTSAIDANEAKAVIAALSMLAEKLNEALAKPTDVTVSAKTTKVIGGEGGTKIEATFSVLCFVS